MQLNLARPKLASSGLFFSLREIAIIGIQMVSALEFIHSRNFIHGDIQPSHIVYDKSGEKVVLIGLGKARRLRDALTLRHFPELMPDTIGSPIFTSINSHHGHTLSRRDDMESLGYVLVYIYRGTLPWQQFPHTSIAEILKKKSSVNIEELCGGLEPLYNYLNSVKRLSFEETPDYVSLRQKLETLAAWS
ncbi:kinase-like protein [Penicillium hetheringtonii]|uniref:Kinase-like protein n=1 Tax=Penicillium hetheringtonii TaxID=911720 RepID=A0AAD6DAJ3_9EURO|nr:kinase-like protein [Penicillium hetheringtonii]